MAWFGPGFGPDFPPGCPPVDGRVDALPGNRETLRKRGSGGIGRIPVVGPLPKASRPSHLPQPRRRQLHR